MTLHVDDLDEYVAGELSAARGREIAAHLRDCPPCATEFQWLKKEQALFAQRRALVVAPVLSPVRPRREPLWGYLGKPVMLTAAAAACLLLVMRMPHGGVSEGTSLYSGEPYCSMPVVASVQESTGDMTSMVQDVSGTEAVEDEYQACLVSSPDAPPFVL